MWNTVRNKNYVQESDNAETEIWPSQVGYKVGVHILQFLVFGNYHKDQKISKKQWKGEVNGNSSYDER